MHAGHRERMRAKYRKLGLPPDPHMQLEMLLYFVRAQIDTNEIAHRLIRRFGSLKEVLEAEEYELVEVEGVGETTAFFLNYSGAIARACNSPPPVKRGIPLDTPERTDNFIRERLAGQIYECVLLAYLDAKGRLIHENLVIDTAHSAVRVESSRRVTAVQALQHRAASVLIGHNHPGGNPMPSQKDRAEAIRLKEALRAIGVGMADFIIVGEDGETYSLGRSGLLP